MKLRKAGRNLTVSYEPEIVQSLDKRHQEIEMPVENGAIEYLKDCMETLPDKQKNCIDLFYLQGKSYKEIAELRNEQIGKIRSFIQNGRRNLKNCIEKKTRIRTP